MAGLKNIKQTHSKGRQEREHTASTSVASLSTMQTVRQQNNPKKAWRTTKKRSQQAHQKASVI